MPFHHKLHPRKAKSFIQQYLLSVHMTTYHFQCQQTDSKRRRIISLILPNLLHLLILKDGDDDRCRRAGRTVGIRSQGNRRKANLCIPNWAMLWCCPPAHTTYITQLVESLRHVKVNFSAEGGQFLTSRLCAHVFRLGTKRPSME